MLVVWDSWILWDIWSSYRSVHKNLHSLTTTVLILGGWNLPWRSSVSVCESVKVWRTVSFSFFLSFSLKQHRHAVKLSNKHKTVQSYQHINAVWLPFIMENPCCKNWFFLYIYIYICILSKSFYRLCWKVSKNIYWNLNVILLWDFPKSRIQTCLLSAVEHSVIEPLLGRIKAVLLWAFLSFLSAESLRALDSSYRTVSGNYKLPLNLFCHHRVYFFPGHI